MIQFTKKNSFKAFVVLLSLCLFIGVLPSFAHAENSFADEDYYEQVALAIYESSTYNKDTKSFDFDEDKAVSRGLDKETSHQVAVYLENLSSDEAENVYYSLEEDPSISPFVPPLLVWAAGVLAAAGLTWLADKLLDWGAQKFCNKYRNSNSITKMVCNVIAP
ncbi:hypothetical protein ACFTQ7_13250 [Lysinibacillus sp. NPDC056959]|uniref:hypothetical protein n=1 Tax=Lysinibacillus sp. NPDC056959 TaxID=3345981 RepID=UPI0036434C9C